MSKHLISILLIAVLCFGMAMPSYAADTRNNYAKSLFEFLGYAYGTAYDTITSIPCWFLDGWSRADVTPDNIQSAYNSYVSSVNSSLGTTVVSDNGFYLCVPFDYSYGGNVTHYGSFVNASINNDYIILKASSAVLMPFSGYATYFENMSFSNADRQSPGYFFSDIYTKSAIMCFVRTSKASGSSLCSASSGIYVKRVSSGAVVSIVGSAGWYIEPADWNTSTDFSFVRNSDSRAPSVISSAISTNVTSTVNKYYIGTKDDQGVVNNTYTTNIFDETTKVLTEPASGTTYNVTNWSYDYSTRVYNLTDGTNNYSVAYGDDYITITVPDGSGGTTSTRYYYVVSEPVPVAPGTDPGTGLPTPSSDNYTDDNNSPSGFFSTVWKALKDGMTSLIAGIIKALFDGIKAIINGITSLFSGVISGFADAVRSFFGLFTSPGIFGFFGQDLQIRGPCYAPVA